MGRSMWTPTGDEQLKRDLANRDRKIGELTRQVAKLTEQVADHAALVARIAELEAELAAARRWEPLPPGQLFVHPKRVPLAEAVVIPEDSGFSQLDLLASDDQDAECDSGHCFL